MMDVRSPGEFAHGAFPTATSLPLLNDSERAQVGICYKEQGQQSAIELGNQIVSGELRAARLTGWAEFARSHPDGFLYCFRGGLRSQTVQQWLRDEGIDYPLVRGGYKAMRRFLLDELERSLQRAEILLIGGKTGSGKTRVIKAIPRSVDLEGLACHRGSTFGQLPEPQPSQIDFENAISIAVLKLLDRGGNRIFLEDEGHLIGRLALPANLREKMLAAPLAVVDECLASRVDVVLEDYVFDLGLRYQRLHGADGPRLHRDKLQHDLYRIRKRLGGERYTLLSALMAQAFELQWSDNDVSGHREWIAALLEQYYDPMYEYQLAQRAGHRLRRGSRRDIISWANGAA
jgi:tRNA 2-selenouridine synthase